MDLSGIIAHLGDTIGPLGALVILCLGWAVVTLWRKVNDLHDKRMEDWREHADATNQLAREIVEVSSGVKVALERAIEDARRG